MESFAIELQILSPKLKEFSPNLKDFLLTQESAKFICWWCPKTGEESLVQGKTHNQGLFQLFYLCFMGFLRQAWQLNFWCSFFLETTYEARLRVFEGHRVRFNWFAHKSIIIFRKQTECDCISVQTCRLAQTFPPHRQVRLALQSWCNEASGRQGKHNVSRHLSPNWMCWKIHRASCTSSMKLWEHERYKKRTFLSPMYSEAAICNLAKIQRVFFPLSE